MTLERTLRGMAGFLVAGSVALANFHSEYWLIVTFVIGLNLFQSAFSNWCPAISLLKKLGLKSCVEAAKDVN